MIVTVDQYRKLIAEDIDWLKTMPATLERDHILLILNYQSIDAKEIVDGELAKYRKDPS
jgi:hypothetical protein